MRPVRSELELARSLFQRAINNPEALRNDERRAATSAEIADAVRTIAAARQRVERSPAVWLTRFIPLVSAQRAGLVEILRDAEDGAGVWQRLLTQVQQLDDQAQIREGLVPLDGLGQLAAEVGGAGERVRGLVRPAAGLWGELGQARRDFNAVAGPISVRLREAGDALGAARTFIGADGDRRHLIAMMNNGEMRDQGMVLSYAVVHFSGGRFRFERSGHVSELYLSEPAPTPVPEGTDKIFGFILPTQLWQSVNATADFGWSGKAMTDMYLKATGEPVDGVIAIDVRGLSSLLRVVGAVVVEGVEEPITAENAARILLHDMYQGLAPDSPQGERRERLADVTKIVIDRLLVASHDAVALGRELGEAAAGGHFRLWSNRPHEEEVFERTGLGGGPAVEDADRTFHVAVQNRTATKLDYYVKPSVRQAISLTPEGDALVRTTVVVDNQAPAGAEPSYLLGPDEFTTRPGEYIGWVLLWGPAGSVQRDSVAESGLVLSDQVPTVQAGERTEVAFETLVPAAVRDGRLRIRLVPQPRLQDVDLSVELDPGPWRLRGSAGWQGAWDRVRTFDWRVERQSGERPGPP